MRRSDASVLLTWVLLLVTLGPAGANSIASIAVHPNGGIFFSDYVRNRIWLFDRGRLSPVVDRHTHHLILDRSGRLWGEHVTPDGGTASLWAISPGGKLSEVLSPARRGDTAGYEGTVFTIDGEDLLYLVECQIVRSTPGQTPVPWAGRNCGGRAWREDTLRYGHLHGSLAWASDGSLLFSDARTIRRVGREGSVLTLDGRATELFDPPLSGELAFERVMGLAVGKRSLYVADRAERSVQQISADGKTQKRFRIGAFWTPTGLAVRDEMVWVLLEPAVPLPASMSRILRAPRLAKLEPNGTFRTIAAVRGTEKSP